jgi:hypothetical protein
MPDYRIYIFSDGHIERAETVEAEDDAAAFTRASILTGGGSFEVWRGAQMVVSLDAPQPEIAAG